MTPRFLSVENVLEIHHDQIRRYGGAAGIRDPSLLQSAVAQAAGTFEGTFLHHTLFEMAAAYLFHLVMDHPFVDGNKRTGGAAALIFLFFERHQAKHSRGRLCEHGLGGGTGEEKETADCAISSNRDRKRWIYQ